MREARSAGRTVMAVAVALVAVTALAAPAAATQWFAVSLDGSREVGDPGDDAGGGTAFLGIDGTTVRYWIFVRTSAQPSAAHIHMGRAGENGGIVVDLEAAFAASGNGHAATGSATADAGTISAILDDPAAYYVNVHTPDFPTGAVRGQLLGDGAARTAFAASLSGAEEVGNPGDPDGSGFAGVVFSGGMAHYWIVTEGIANPGAAHIHTGRAGENGGIAVDFEASFTDGVASGSASVDPDVAAGILADPSAYYVNVHNGDFPAGALRGQLRPTETTLGLPVISRAQGRAGSNWRTDLRIVNPSRSDLTVWAEWYPLSASGHAAPAATATLVVAARGEAVVNDAVAALFGADGNGALRLLATEPVSAAARIFNDQSENPDVGGTYGQFVAGLRPEAGPRAGALMLASQSGSPGQSGFRTNLGYFNPTPWQVHLRLALVAPGGDVLGVSEMDVPGFAGDLEPVFDLVPPDGGGEIQDFLVVYAADGPIQMYTSTVDNVTGDAIYVQPSAAPPTMAAAPNSAPTAEIVEPAGDVTIDAGQSVTFSGSASDPDGDPLTYLWDFGDGSTSTELSPGAHSFTDAGTYSVTFTATDSHGASASDSVTVTVQGGGSVSFSQVQSQIFTANCAFSGCHAGTSPAQGMNLSAGQAYANIVNVPSNEMPGMDRIEPGSPSMSYLWLKVTGDPSIAGSRMPPGGQLSESQLDLLRSWIEAGAPDDGAGGDGNGGGGVYGASLTMVPSH